MVIQTISSLPLFGYFWWNWFCIVVDRFHLVLLALTKTRMPLADNETNYVQNPNWTENKDMLKTNYRFNKEWREKNGLLVHISSSSVTFVVPKTRVKRKICGETFESFTALKRYKAWEL